MITSMSDRLKSPSNIICITNRALCRGDYLARLAAIADAPARAIVLREKDLSEDAYAVLAAQVLAQCAGRGTPCILHAFPHTAKRLGCKRIHLPLAQLRALEAADQAAFSCTGTSVHSVEEARESVRLGASYLIAGHIFATDCKKGLPPRGLSFLQEVCAAVPAPVYAIGGIGAEHLAQVRRAGAAGACVMSGLMQCADPSAALARLQQAWDAAE